ncbi:MAG: protein kinase [Deltaproteobacteria bacterium]|nr:protein kinase [Deltaproteobacteria bacterium]
MTTFKCPHCGGEHPDGTDSCPETGEELTQTQLQVGKIIGGKYELLRLLGEGGMGAVYEARHVEIRQHVALKLLHFQLARDQEIRQRFFREAMSAGEIGHENIIEMHDIGRDVTGSIYLVMELLKGESLAEKVRRVGAMDVAQAADVMLQALDALNASHAKGITHRDMKPENVFLCRLGGRDDFVKILDFGIAKVKDPEDGEALTRTGAMLGTACYMAPEQIAGDREADHRMDIYACGIILYQMLAGRVPFDSTSIHTVIYKIMNEDPPPLSEFRANLPHEIEEIVRRAITRNRDHRYQTVADFAHALTPFGSGRVVFGRGSQVPAAPIAVGTAPTTASSPGASPVAAPAPVQALDQPTAAPPPAHATRAAPPAAPPRKASTVGIVLLIVIPLLLLGLVAMGVMALVGGWAIFRPEDPDTDVGPKIASVDASTSPADAGQEKPVETFRVTVDTVPAGGTISVDGQSKGTAPVTLDLPEGVTAVTAKADGFPTRTMPCKVEKGLENTCVISLTTSQTTDASTDASTGQEVTIVDDEPDKKKKKKKKKCDPRKNPKCKFIKRP